MKNNISGKISINKCGMSSNPKNSNIMITIQDESSGVCVMRLKLSIEEYGMLISGQSDRDCKISHLINEVNIKNIGKNIECKDILIPEFNRLSYLGKLNKKELEIKLFKLVQPYLVDGWEINSLGLNSQQGHVGGHRVSLKRYVSKNK